MVAEDILPGADSLPAAGDLRNFAVGSHQVRAVPGADIHHRNRPEGKELRSLAEVVRHIGLTGEEHHTVQVGEHRRWVGCRTFRLWCRTRSQSRPTGA